MEQRRFERLKARVAVGLTASQCLQLASVLSQKAEAGMAEVIVAQGEKMVCDDRKCRLCGHSDVVLHGKDEKGRQRFRCRRTDSGGCGKTFNGLTQTVLARMRKPNLWLAYTQTMPTHLSVAKTAERLGVAHVTAHRWRLRLLSVQAVQEASTLKGVVEARRDVLPLILQGFSGMAAWSSAGEPHAALSRRQSDEARPVGRAGAGADGG